MAYKNLPNRILKAMLSIFSMSAVALCHEFRNEINVRLFS